MWHSEPPTSQALQEKQSKTEKKELVRAIHSWDFS